MNVVLIEDEPMLAEELQRYITALRKDWQMVQVLRSVKEAITWFSANRDYQLVFSDIQLGDGLSFSIFQRIKIESPVIFCTAYNKYAIEAFKNNGIDYMLKPIHQKSMEEAILRYETLKASMTTNSPDYSGLIHHLTLQQPAGSLLVSHRDKIIPIRIEDVALLFVHSGLVCLRDFQQNKYFVNHTLDELEIMTSGKFYRADRQHLVNRRAIKDVSQYFGRKLLLNLIVDYDQAITIRKEKAADFLKWLKQ